MRFARAMESRLRANDHKGGWTHDNADFFLAHLADELFELVIALDRRGERPSHYRLERITDEAADLANFAMMIADQYGLPEKVKE
jgi:NTP pyrophosphatase (non-canonical NTP hydrolase)